MRHLERLEQMKKGSNEPAIEIWELPSWAADTIQETMANDATSNFFSHELREKIAKANDEMRTITTQYKQMAGTLNEVIATLYPEGYDPEWCSSIHPARKLTLIEAAIARYMAPTD